MVFLVGKNAEFLSGSTVFERFDYKIVKKKKTDDTRRVSIVFNHAGWIGNREGKKQKTYHQFTSERQIRLFTAVIYRCQYI